MVYHFLFQIDIIVYPDVIGWKTRATLVQRFPGSDDAGRIWVKSWVWFDDGFILGLQMGRDESFLTITIQRYHIAVVL